MFTQFLGMMPHARWMLTRDFFNALSRAALWRAYGRALTSMLFYRGWEGGREGGGVAKVHFYESIRNAHHERRLWKIQVQFQFIRSIRESITFITICTTISRCFVSTVSGMSMYPFTLISSIQKVSVHRLDGCDRWLFRAREIFPRFSRENTLIPFHP